MILTIMKHAHKGTSASTSVSIREIVGYCQARNLTSKRIAMTAMHENHQPGYHSIGKCVNQDDYSQALGISREHASIRHGFN